MGGEVRRWPGCWAPRSGEGFCKSLESQTPGGGGSQGSVPGFTCSLRCLAVEVVVVFNVSFFCSGRSTDYGDQKVRFKCRTTDLHPV